MGRHSKYSLRRCLDIHSIGERLEVPGKIDNNELQLPSGEPQASTRLYIYMCILILLITYYLRAAAPAADPGRIGKEAKQIGIKTLRCFAP